MDIRPLNTTDLPAVRQRASELAATLYPELIGDIEAMHGILADLVHSSTAYTKVVGPKGAPVAALVANIGKLRWATRKRAVVELWYSDLPGAGYRLLVDFRKWVQAQKNVVLAGMVFDIPDPMAPDLIAQRAGFHRRGNMNVYYPRGAKL